MRRVPPSAPLFPYTTLFRSIWSGGGIAHGPKPRSYDQRVNRKMKRAALRSALSDALSSGKLAVVEGLAFEGPRTKDAAAVLEARSEEHTSELQSPDHLVCRL